LHNLNTNNEAKTFPIGNVVGNVVVFIVKYSSGYYIPI